MIPLYGNNPADSHTLGFPSGFYKDGSTLFPGIGRFPERGTTPARMSVGKSDRGVGAYGAYPGEFDAWEGRYFMAHPNLKWILASLNDTQSELIPRYLMMR